MTAYVIVGIYIDQCCPMRNLSLSYSVKVIRVRKLNELRYARIMICF